MPRGRAVSRGENGAFGRRVRGANPVGQSARQAQNQRYLKNLARRKSNGGQGG